MKDTTPTESSLKQDAMMEEAIASAELATPTTGTLKDALISDGNTVYAVEMKNLTTGETGKEVAVSAGDKIEFVYPKSATPTESWEEEFDKKFKHVHHPLIQADNILRDTSGIKDFIRTQLSLAEQRGREEAVDYCLAHFTTDAISVRHPDNMKVWNAARQGTSTSSPEGV